MSDTPPASDWWLASDGKWYPPTSQPGPVHAATWSRRMAVSPVLSGWVQALLAISAVFSAGVAVTAFQAYSIVNADSFNRFVTDGWLDANDRNDVAIGLFFLSFIVTAVLVVIWTFKAHQATNSLQPHHRSWAPGWSIGGWFIPLANLVIPKLVLNETERIARAPRNNGQVTPDWRNESTSALGWVWWLAFVAGWISIGVGSSFDVEEAAVRPISDLRATYLLYGSSGVFYVVASVLGALHVRRISALLSPRELEPASTPTYESTSYQQPYQQQPYQ